MNVFPVGWHIYPMGGKSSAGLQHYVIKIMATSFIDDVVTDLLKVDFEKTMLLKFGSIGKVLAYTCYQNSIFHENNFFIKPFKQLRE